MNPELDKFDAANQQPQALTIEVSVQELNTIFAALGELPHRVSDPIMRKLFGQANEQLPKA
jgi:hypothetical protein